jgi:hypothetical protein
MGKKRLIKIPEERLIGSVLDWRASYFIGQYTDKATIDDEAITNLACQIVEADPRHRQHIGQIMEVSLVCASRYSVDRDDPARPSLFYVTLRKNQRSVLSYLPADAYWSLPTLLTRPTDPCIELSFERLHRGTGELRSLWIGSYKQLIEDHAAIAALTRSK